jgi:hypothetical protein
MIVKPSTLPKGLPRCTQSICPECKRVIDAELRAENGKVLMIKECRVHGAFEDVVWSDVRMYLRMERWAYDGVGVENPKIRKARECPADCGLCNMHLSHTALANIDLTNRCNLRCPICFANASAAGYVYEPSYETIVRMLETLRANRPVPTPAVQFSGGEPTLHPRLLDIVRTARELNFTQIQLATNGIRIAEEPAYAQKLLDAGVHTIYLQFDGVRDEDYVKARGRKLFELKKKVIEACRRTSPTPLAVCLVPTIVKGINDDQVGAILEFALRNADVVRAVNYQPVAFTGRISKNARERQRFTLGDLAERLEQQTGFLKKEDFYPTPCVAPVSELSAVLAGEPKVAFTAHPHCGIGTYLFVNGGSVIPITRFVEVEAILEETYALARSLTNKPARRLRGAIGIAYMLHRHIDRSRAPAGVNVRNLLKAIFTSRTKKALADFNWCTLFVGGMHFQDDYNYDIERLKRCTIHYPTPDGRIIPFCAYNGGPMYRTVVEERYGVPFEDRNPKS